MLRFDVLFGIGRHKLFNKQWSSYRWSETSLRSCVRSWYTVVPLWNGVIFFIHIYKILTMNTPNSLPRASYRVSFVSSQLAHAENPSLSWCQIYRHNDNLRWHARRQSWPRDNCRFLVHDLNSPIHHCLVVYNIRPYWTDAAISPIQWLAPCIHTDQLSLAFL